MKALKATLATLAVTLTAVALYLHKDVSDQPDFVTSEQCESCHQPHYTAWEKTLHPYQFRPVTNPEKDILGDFTSDNPALTFRKEEVEFVIGNKWEQVYARKIDGEYYPLPAKWYVLTQKWVPYKVNNWRETPLSTKCNGCHTTGFNPDTFEFSEYGIGCEACHGPGSQHVHNHKINTKAWCSICHQERDTSSDIVNTVNPAICGQCHSRGKEKRKGSEHLETVFNFPVTYITGDDMGSGFKPLTQKQDAKQKYWWGLGLSKNRHQEFADFSKSKHSKAHTLLKEKKRPDQGKLSDECLSCHSADYIHAKPGQKPTLDNAKFGVTCAVCHEPHGLDRHFFPEQKRTRKCGTCHVSSMAAKDDERSHFPCPSAEVECADCHMPFIVKSGGGYPLRSHAFRIVPPHASTKYKMPNSCQNGGCHQDKPVAWAVEAFEAFYPELIDARFREQFSPDKEVTKAADPRPKP
jgi:hypothetical protein